MRKRLNTSAGLHLMVSWKMGFSLTSCSRMCEHCPPGFGRSGSSGTFSGSAALACWAGCFWLLFVVFVAVGSASAGTEEDRSDPLRPPPFDDPVIMGKLACFETLIFCGTEFAGAVDVDCETGIGAVEGTDEEDDEDEDDNCKDCGSGGCDCDSSDADGPDDPDVDDFFVDPDDAEDANPDPDCCC